MNSRSLAFRLTAWYAGLLALLFALVSAAGYLGLQQYLRATLRDTLMRRTEQVAQIITQSPANVSDQQLRDSLELQIAPEFTNRFLRVIRNPGIDVFRSTVPANHAFDPSGIPVVEHSGSSLETNRVLSREGIPLLLVSRRVDAPSGSYLVELGSSLESVETVRDRLLTVLAVLLPILTALAVAGGYVLVGKALSPVDEMAQTAERISIQNLDARLPVAPTGDALERLSHSLNTMLARLRESVLSSQRFLADASHELRTPLTIIKGELEELRRRPSDADETAERLDSVLEEVDRLKSLVEGLLSISRLDAGDAQREALPVDLGELASNTADQMRLLAEDRGITLTSGELQSVWISGDKARIKQVLVNLLDNAIKYSDSGATVTVRTLRSGRTGVLEVRDTGAGISEQALPHIFERFYRADPARKREGNSVGLGLSIVKAIATAHGAELEVLSTPGVGSSFRVRFPLLDRSAKT